MALEGNFKTGIADLVTGLVEADKVNINEAIFQNSFGVGSFSQAHTIVTDRRTGNLQPIVLATNHYGSMPVGDETLCDLNECDLTPSYSTKKWELAEYNCRMDICMRSFDESFLMFWNMYRQGLEDPTTEPDAQAFLDYIEGIVRENLLGTQWRVGYWGDTASANTLISGNDGFFAQAEAGSGEKIELTIAGTEPTGEELYNTLADAYDYVMAQTWGNDTDLVIKTTYAVAAKLVTWLNRMSDTSMYNCDCFSADGITAKRRFTVEGLTIFGMKVDAHREIDDSGTAVGITQVEKYKMLIARKSNLLIGVNTDSKLEMFDLFYDKKDRKIYIDTLTRLGVMIPLDEYVYITEPDEEA